MKFTLDKHEKYVLVKLEESKLNTLNSAQLKSEFIVLNNEGFKNLILDLKNVKYIDSSGLSSILVANRLCKTLGGTFVITHANPIIGKLVAISRLENILTLLESNEEAIDLVFMEELEREFRGHVE